MRVLCLSFFCYALLCVLSSFAIILQRKKELVALLSFHRDVLLLLMFCGSSSRSRTVGWSAVCDCGIS